MVEEIRVRLLQVTQCLLQGDAGHVVEEAQVFVALPLGEHPARVLEGDVPPVTSPRFGTQCQRLVVNKPSASQSASQQFLLLRRGVETEPVGPSYTLRTHACNYTSI